MTTTVDLRAAAEELVRSLAGQPSGRAATTLTPGAHAPLKQTLLALAAGNRLQDHRAPGRATIEVIVGQVQITVGDEGTVLAAGQWALIPDQVHGLLADEDSVALLTVANAAGADATEGR